MLIYNSKLNLLQVFTKILIVICILIASFNKSVNALECYQNTMIGTDIKTKTCDSLKSYCVKANIYDGTVSRDCTSFRQCPQVVIF